MKKFIVIAFMALAVTMIATVPAKASDVTPTEEASPTPSAIPNPYSKLVIRQDGSVDMWNLSYYYIDMLNDDQREIVDYLIGLSNYMYMTARGFTYENINTSAELVSRLTAYGRKFFGDGTIDYPSRLTNYLQRYLASVISYASTITDDFETWLSNNQGELFIPYTNAMLDSWTAFYNDPSTTGVINWGITERQWELGNQYDFAFSAYLFANSNEQSRYNSFILNSSPVIYSDTYRVNSSLTRQTVLSLQDLDYVDTIYVLRGTNGYQYYRFGRFNGDFSQNNISNIECRYYYGEVYTQINTGASWNFEILNSGSLGTISNLLNNAIYVTPFKFSGNQQQYFHNWYYLINHVVLVDDLSTLSNRQEIFDVLDLGINGDDAGWIDRPDGDMYFPVVPDGNIYNEGDNTMNISDPDDFHRDIVNNTVINNYNIVAPGSIINVPVDWLESDGNYLDYTNTAALPFFVMVGDIFNALGELRIFIIGVLILGLAGGILVKFLL